MMIVESRLLIVFAALLAFSIVSLHACHGSVDYIDFGEHRAGIFSMEVDGSGLEPLWLGDVPFTMLELSPDESTVVLSLFQEDVNGDGLYNDLDFSSTAIATLPIDGSSDPHVIFDGPGVDLVPSWSPRGDRIILSTSLGRGGASADVVTIDPSGRRLRNLTQTEGMSEGDPSWSPGIVLFTRFNTETWNTDIWAISPIGIGETRLTRPALSPHSEHTYNFGHFDPHLSPDKTAIAFEEHKDVSWEVGGFAVGDFDVHVMDIDSEEVRVICDTSDADVRPIWSADGRMLTFFRVKPDPRDVSDIVVSDLETGECRVLNPHPRLVSEQWPVWLDSSHPHKVDGRPDLIFAAGIVR